MPRDKKTVSLRAVDEAEPEPPVLLADDHIAAPGSPTEPIRLELPSKENHDLRTHQPGIDAIIETFQQPPNLAEQEWGTSSRINPIIFAWCSVIGLILTGAVVWSLNYMRQTHSQTEQIRTVAESTLQSVKQDDQEATATIERLQAAVREFFNATTVEELAPLVRQPERVLPLMSRYYAHRPVFSSRLKTVQLFLPLSINNCANYWMITAILNNGQSRHLFVEDLDTKETRIDWETLVSYQPIPWDDFVTQRPTSTSLDFRVTVTRDHFYSHEFADSQHWSCFLLSAPESSETLFGYAPADSSLAQAINQQIEASNNHQASLILRLSIPERLQSHRGVMIENILSNQWLYFTPPAVD